MHVQSCCFACLNLLLFCRSRFRHRRRCVNSLIKYMKRSTFESIKSDISNLGWPMNYVRVAHYRKFWLWSDQVSNVDHFMCRTQWIYFGDLFSLVNKHCKNELSSTNQPSNLHYLGRLKSSVLKSSTSWITVASLDDSWLMHDLIIIIIIIIIITNRKLLLKSI